MPTVKRSHRKQISDKNLHIPPHKLPVPAEQKHLFDYIYERSKQVARSIAETINTSNLDQGGIIYIYGPLHSGKTLAGIALTKYLGKTRSFIQAQPKVNRSDVVEGYFYSKNGTKVPVATFSNRDEIQKLFDENDVVIVDEVMFIPYKMQSLFLKEVERFKERGGWFVGMGLLYTGPGTEFLLSSLMIERADKVFHLQATCQKCGRRNAIIGQRLVNGRPPSVGDPELLPPSASVIYEPRCADCYVVFS